MKTAWKLTMALVLVLSVLAACSQKEQEQPKQAAPAVQPQSGGSVQPSNDQKPGDLSQPAEPGQPGESSQAGQAAGPAVELTGTLVKTDEGMALFTDSGNYQIEGQDVSAMVGQNVKISGSVHDKEGKQMLTVSSVSVIQ